MGVVIGRLDDQVAKIFLGNNLTKSTKDYQKILEDENLTPEEKERILAARKKKEDEETGMDPFLYGRQRRKSNGRVS